MASAVVDNEVADSLDNSSMVATEIVGLPLVIERPVMMSSKTMHYCFR